MRVGSGMTVQELLLAANKHNLSVQIGSVPAYAGLTLGGLLATSGHGTGFGMNSALADTVTQVTWVDGTGRIRTTNRKESTFKGFAGGLGSFGIITELVIQMERGLTLTTVETFTFDDTDMMTKINSLLEMSPHVQIMYYPDAGKFKAFVLTKAAPGTPYDSTAQAFLLPDFSKFPPGLLSSVGLFGKVVDTWANTTNDDSMFNAFICPQLVFNGPLGLHWAAVGSKYPLTGVANVTGLSNNLQSSSCEPGCTWSPQFTLNMSWHDVEFAIEFSQLKDWLADLKKVIKTELQDDGKAASRCIQGFTILRFGKALDAYTSMTAGMQQPVYVDHVWFRSNRVGDKPMHDQYVVDLMEEHTLVAYKGRPHWGKLFDRTMTHPKRPLATLYGAGFQSLLQLKSTYDPGSLFASALFDKVVNKQPYELSPKCSVLQTCYCQSDEHCGDGFKCVAAVSFPQYKVCKAKQVVDMNGGVLCQVNPLFCSG